MNHSFAPTTSNLQSYIAQQQTEEVQEVQVENHDERDYDTCSETSTTRLKRFSNYQKMIEMISVSAITPVIIISDVGQIKSVNELVTQLTRYRRWELIQQMLMTEADAEHHDAYLRRYKISKQKRVMGEVRDGLSLVRSDGKVYSISLKVNALSTDSGSVYIGVINDQSSKNSLAWTKNIVYNVFPKPVAHQMKKKISTVEEYTGTIGTIQLFFNDHHQMNADEEFEKMNSILEKLDDLTQKWGCEKVKGDYDEYNVACGVLHLHNESHAIRVMKLIVEISAYLLSQHIPFRGSCATGIVRTGMLGSGWRFQWARQVSKELLQQAKFSQILINDETYHRTNYFLPNSASQKLDEGVYAVQCTDLPLSQDYTIEWNA